jgi:hypothetical protein
MRRVPLLAMLAVLLSVFVAPASAAPSEGILLRGSRTAYVDLYVYENTTIDTASLRVTGGRSYAGFFLAPAPANRDTVGALVMPRVGASGSSAASMMRLGDSWDVQAGKYRAYLIADGPAEVFIPIAGQGLRGWVPTRSASFSVRGADFSVPAGGVSGHHRRNLTLRARSLVVAAGRATSTSVTAVDHLNACVSASGECSTTVALTARLPAATAWTYGVELVQPGTYAGVLDLTRIGGPDAGSHVDGAVMVLTLGIQS